MCTECRTSFAVRATPDFKRTWCLNCFEYVYDDDEELQRVGYRRFKAESKVCSECEMKLATQECRQCDDVYCDECNDRLHRTGRKAEHTQTIINPWEKDELEEGEAYCSECEERKADRICDQCGDPIATNALHARMLRGANDSTRSQHGRIRKLLGKNFGMKMKTLYIIQYKDERTAL